VELYRIPILSPENPVHKEKEEKGRGGFRKKPHARLASSYNHFPSLFLGERKESYRREGKRRRRKRER